MKKSLFYIFMALVCAACLLAGCRKDKSGPSDSTGLGTALDNAGSANCYIVSDAGKYSFSAVKGNGKKPIGNIASVEVLWETFGTDTAPQPGDLIAEVSYDEAKNAVCFATAAEFSKGNALIGAKDARGKILWSWHIWMTDKPEDQVYLNGAGTMMDRNLGATSATPGDVGALGLLYQWGRKDPFMGASAIAEGTTTQAATTIGTWPNYVNSNATTGTVDYAVANPTTFIAENISNNGWHYNTVDRNLWSSEKTVYDPCPPGYKVPSNFIWYEALGLQNLPVDTEVSGFDTANLGYDFGASGQCDKKLTAESSCWYPMAGYLYYDYYEESKNDVVFSGVGSYGRNWSRTPYIGDPLYSLTAFNRNDTSVSTSKSYRGASAYSVRCLKENK